jgi:hypothetical protein
MLDWILARFGLIRRSKIVDFKNGYDDSLFFLGLLTEEDDQYVTIDSVIKDKVQIRDYLLKILN